MPSPHHKISPSSGYVYLAKCFTDRNHNGWFKFGYSKNDPYKRVRDLNQLKKHGNIKIISFCQSLNGRACERLVLSFAAAVSKEMDGEYFYPDCEESFLIEQFISLSDVERNFIRFALRNK